MSLHVSSCVLVGYEQLRSSPSKLSAVDESDKDMAPHRGSTESLCCSRIYEVRKERAGNDRKEMETRERIDMEKPRKWSQIKDLKVRNCRDRRPRRSMKLATGEPCSWAEKEPLVVLPQHRGVGGEPRAPHTVSPHHHLPEFCFLSQVSVLGDPLGHNWHQHRSWTPTTLHKPMVHS
ncbi:hypothetical protein P171DRAFT_86195 [Karstenula rhodostoma CBS 690.94]|uniref:Uncharacterized protein n=1 Tax=Karstenula rhodostoma CBS 690.94 TaxID=1392251 RepID=A0A9P4U8K0_9PLEO|nr:hypothetical protein P171DRAFT_86195 [Karstenula rhodostoma CBS 690.94]